MDPILQDTTRRYAAAAFDTAKARGYDIPAEVDTYRAIIRESEAIAHQGATFAPATMPANAADLDAYITTTARKRAESRETAGVAAEVADHARRALAHLALGHAPTVAAQIAADFEAHAEQLVDLLGSAPRTVDAYTTPADVEKYQDLLRTLSATTIDIAHRLALAPLLDETETPAIWLYLAPSEDATVFQVRELTKDYGNTIPSTPEAWESIARVGVSMAGAGEGASRTAWWADVQLRAGTATPDGGRLDKTIRDALAAGLTGQPWTKPATGRRIIALR